MKIVNKFQQGGAMAQPAPEAAPAQDPVAQIVEMFMMGLQNQDCAALAAGAEMFLSLVQQASAPAPMGAPAEQAPVFKRGGQIRRK